MAALTAELLAHHLGSHPLVTEEHHLLRRSNFARRVMRPVVDGNQIEPGARVATQPVVPDLEPGNRMATAHVSSGVQTRPPSHTWLELSMGSLLESDVQTARGKLA